MASGEDNVRLAGLAYPSEAEVEAIARAVEASSSKLKRLELGFNGIGDAGAEKLAAAVVASHESSGVGSGSLTRLLLYDNGITDVGALALAAALPRSRLTELSLDGNEITDVGACALAEAIEATPSSSLEKLGLDGNKITDVGAVCLAAALQQSRSLTDVYLSYNPGITDVGAFALAKALLSARKLTHFYLRGDGITSKGERAVEVALAVANAIRTTLWLLTGEARSKSSACTSFRRFVLARDGDHAIWSRVVGFLADSTT